MFNLIPVAKFATQLVAGIGVSKVIGDVLKGSTTAVTRMDSIRNKIGVAVISGIIADQGTKKIDAKIDSLAEWYVNRNTTEEESSEVEES